jgi:hypothetical protein
MAPKVGAAGTGRKGGRVLRRGNHHQGDMRDEQQRLTRRSHGAAPSDRVMMHTKPSTASCSRASSLAKPLASSSNRRCALFALITLAGSMSASSSTTVVSSAAAIANKRPTATRFSAVSYLLHLLVRHADNPGQLLLGEPEHDPAVADLAAQLEIDRGSGVVGGGHAPSSRTIPHCLRSIRKSEQSRGGGQDYPHEQAAIDHQRARDGDLPGYAGQVESRRPGGLRRPEARHAGDR